MPVYYLDTIKIYCHTKSSIYSDGILVLISSNLILIFALALDYTSQRCSQNAEKVWHIKGRLFDQAMILFNCVPFQIGTSIKGKNLLPGGANSFLYEQFLIVWKITFITLSDLP